MMKKVLFGRIETGVIIGAVLVVLLFVTGTRGAWLGSVPSVLNLTAQTGIVVIGQALLMTAGEIDLSVGSVFAFGGVVFLVLLDRHVGVALAIPLALAVAGLIGWVNGLVTMRFKVPSMIVTLGSLFVFRGLTYVLTTGYSLSVPKPYRNDAIIALLHGRLLGFANAVYILVVLAAVFVFMLARTRLGSHILAVGGEPDAALANGVPPARVKTTVFVMCSVLAAAAGIIATCQEGNVYSSSGRLMELDTIAAAVIGGCTLTGGIGSVWGAVLGVFVLSSLKGGLMMMGAPTYWYEAFVGLILIGFLASSKLLSNRVALLSQG